MNFTISNFSKYYSTQYCLKDQCTKRHCSSNSVLALATPASQGLFGLPTSVETQCSRTNMFWMLLQVKQQLSAPWGPHHLSSSRLCLCGPHIPLCIFAKPGLVLIPGFLLGPPYRLLGVHWPHSPINLHLWPVCIICLTPKTWSSTWKIKSEVSKKS